MEFLYVFLGGGLGSVCRYGIARLLVAEHMKFPLATVTSNILACFVLGLLMGWAMRNGQNRELLLFGMIGFCGGFSTFSTFSLENYELLRSGDLVDLLLNVVLSLLLCFVSIAAGIKLAQ